MSSNYNPEYRIETVTDDAGVENLLRFNDFAIMKLDPMGYIHSWNPGVFAIFELTSDEVIGKHISVCYGYEERKLGQPWHNLQVARTDGRCESEFINNIHGTNFLIRTIITALYNDDHTFSGFALVSHDITKRNQQVPKVRKRKILNQAL